MGLTIAFFGGIFVLAIALIYGAFQYRHRNRATTREGEDVARERYRRDEV